VIREALKGAAQIAKFRFLGIWPYWSCAYKRIRKCLDFQVKNKKGASFALTLRLRRPGNFGLRRYHADLIGGKGGTRTLDPGIMSAVL
jgi:hypothetical protein